MIENVLLINDNIKDIDVIVDSINYNTKAIIYNANTTSSYLYDELAKLTSIKRLGIFSIFDDYNLEFLNGTKLFDAIDFDDIDKQYSVNLQLMIDIIIKYDIKNVDYFSCDILSFSSFQKYFKILETETNAIIGISNNKTGNIKQGGDWIMESTGENIQFAYFNHNINSYNYLLDLVSSTMIIQKNDGFFYASGSNNAGSFGNNNNVSSRRFVKCFQTIPTNSTILNVNGHSSDATFMTTIINTTTGLYACGANEFGQFGNGTNISSSSLVPAFTQGYPTGKIIKNIVFGQYNAFLIMTDNTVYACGANPFGQFGNGTNISSSSLVPAFTQGYPTGKIIKQVYTGYTFTLIWMTDNTVYACGINTFGQFGNGTTTDSFSLVLAFTQGFPINKTIQEIYVGSSVVMIKMTDKSCYACGANPFGQFGNGTNISSSSLVPAFTSLQEQIDKVILSRRLTLVYTTNKNYYMCGINTSGAFGNGTFISSNLLINAFTSGFPLNKTISKISLLDETTYILTSDGLLYGCGANSSGQLGNGTNANSSILINTETNVFNIMNSTWFNNPFPITNKNNLEIFLLNDSLTGTMVHSLNVNNVEMVSNNNKILLNMSENIINLFK